MDEERKKKGGRSAHVDISNETQNPEVFVSEVFASRPTIITIDLQYIRCITCLLHLSEYIFACTPSCSISLMSVSLPRSLGFLL